MYNPEIKERFLEEYVKKSNRVKIAARFRSLEERELLLSKDVAEMSVSEAISAFRSLEFYELGSVEVFISMIRSYVEWCRDNHVFQNYCGGALDVSAKDIDPSVFMSRMFFRDEQDFLYSMRKVDAFDDLNNHVVALALAWLGLDVEEALAIRESEIDFEDRKIFDRFGVELVPWFSDGIANVLIQYRDTGSAIRQNATTTYEVVKDRTFDGFIKRVCPPGSKKMGDPISSRQMVGAIGRMNDRYVALGYPPRLSTRNVLRCGGLHRVWLLEQQGVDVFDKKNAELVESAYGFAKYRVISWQYKYYKKAFNL